MARPTKPRITFVCQDCGHTSPKWEGRCSGCNNWGTYLEVLDRAHPSTERHGRTDGRAQIPSVLPLSVQGGVDEQRIMSGMPEVDRLLGGGIVSGSMVLLAGDPGIGKSTLLLQIAAHFARTTGKVLYVSGEESGAQVRMRGERLGANDSGVLFTAETDVDAVISALEHERPKLAVVDSIQTLFSAETNSTSGSVVQVRDCAQLLLGWAKSEGVAILIAGHVTKDGNIAGPRVLEHMVDVVLYLEGDDMSPYRMLRCTKNRFGSTNDVALFEMAGRGLSEIVDPSSALIAERQASGSGSAVIVTIAGSLPLLSEVQALTNFTTAVPPRRSSNGVDFNRMNMLSAVLSRHGRLALGNQDIMVNIPGGIRISEPAADLGLVLSIASSYLEIPLDATTIFLGEIGLNGEVRTVPHVERRLTEAARHGFETAMLPSRTVRQLQDSCGMKLVGIENLKQGFVHCGLARLGSR